MKIDKALAIKKLDERYKNEIEDMKEYIAERTELDDDFAPGDEVDPEGDWENTIWENGWLAGFRAAVEVIKGSRK